MSLKSDAVKINMIVRMIVSPIRQQNYLQKKCECNITHKENKHYVI